MVVEDDPCPRVAHERLLADAHNAGLADAYGVAARGEEPELVHAESRTPFPYETSLPDPW